MNKGTAKKWCEFIIAHKDEFIYENSALGFQINDKLFRSPLGMLAEFLDPGQFKEDGCGNQTFHGEVFYLPESFKKRCKMKTNCDEMYNDFDILIGFHEAEAAQLGLFCAWEFVVQYIENNYEKL